MFFSGPPALIQYITNFDVSCSILIFLTFFTLALSFLYFKNHSIQNIEISKSIHNCFHFCRDETIAVLNNSKSGKRIDSITKLSESLCVKTREFFITTKQSKSKIGVAIRMANIDDKNPGSYATIARAGLSPSRNKSTQAISKDEGVAKFLLSNKASGCAIYKNINETDSQFYIKTNNDTNYKEVSSMIAVPINKDNEMIGILHITSDKKNFFSQDDVEYAKAFADLSATILSHKMFEIESA